MLWFLKFIFEIKLCMFRTVPLSMVRSFSPYTQQWYMSYRLADSLRAGSRCFILVLLEGCLQTCMTNTIAVCTVKNFWWWTEELSETCRVSFQNKFEKLVRLVGFIKKICHDAQSHERKIVTFILTRFIRPFIYVMAAMTNILQLLNNL
jgi:hypothetical protein